MTIRVNNVNELFDLINSAKGDVFLRPDNGEEINLKGNALARELLNSLVRPGTYINLRASDRADYMTFMGYMLCSGFESRVA